MRRALAFLVAVSSFALLAGACRFDRSYRDVTISTAGACTVGEKRCNAEHVEECARMDGGTGWIVRDDCAAKSLICAPGIYVCASCRPADKGCKGADVLECSADGSTRSVVKTCDVAAGELCVDGTCANLCARAEASRSNVGCEYWAVDLDNANVGPGLNAAAQQFAVVVSNPGASLASDVTIEQDDSLPGETPKVRVVAQARVLPQALEVFKLGPREIDGSPEGTFDTGTGTALTRAAYRIRATAPIVAYQFNPLENANVFSNDASQLLPTTALLGSEKRSYVVAGWPQTIATSTIPSQNFGQDLRAFVTLVGTHDGTSVTIKPTARVISGGPFPDGLEIGQEATVTLNTFDVLNLESGAFNADFTGTLIDADKAVAVFTGSEASDAPFFGSLSERFCCADHLEEQNSPIRTAGSQYVLARMPNRSRAVIAAGARIGATDEPEYFRIVTTRPGMTQITTTLPPPWHSFALTGEGQFVTITVRTDVEVSASQAVIVADVQASQDAAGVPRGVPGGDPSLTYVPPVEQWRNEYVLLTPDKYSFDFLVITAPNEAAVYLDGLLLTKERCEVASGDGLTDAQRGNMPPAHLIYRCQLSFPVIDPNGTWPTNVTAGRQDDGVHRIVSDRAVGVVVYGFDSFVSYAYAGGTDLREINVR